MRKPDQNMPEYLERLIVDPLSFQKSLFKTPFTIEQLAETVELAIGVMQNRPNYIELDEHFRDLAFVGDTHGIIKVTSRVVKAFLAGKVTSLVFLGDYVDRGPQSLVNLVLVLALAIAWPENVTVLKGNHEDVELNKVFGFLAELKQLYPAKEELESVTSLVDRLYDWLSLAVMTPQRTIGLHAGIPSDMARVSEFNLIPKPHSSMIGMEDKTAMRKCYGFFVQSCWNDPRENQQEPFIQSPRGNAAFTFNGTVVDQFLSNSEARRIIRAHESTRGGFQTLFGGRLLHVFSAEPYFKQVLAGRVIHEQKDDVTMLCDLDLNPVQQLHPSRR
jgi:hypothetical protein